MWPLMASLTNKKIAVYNKRKKLPLQFPLSQELFERAKIELEMMDKQRAIKVSATTDFNWEKNTPNFHLLNRNLTIAPELQVLLQLRNN